MRTYYFTKTGKYFAWRLEKKLINSNISTLAQGLRVTKRNFRPKIGLTVGNKAKKNRL
jgi:hypothetical protein